MDKILLFIPMYNCQRQIVKVIEQLSADVCQYIDEVIVVNNCSTDNGEKVLTEYLQTHSFPIQIKLLRNKNNYGLGGSHKVAFDYALKGGFSHVILLHGDNQGNINNLKPYLKNKEYRDYDCFLGARFMKGSHLDGYSKIRTFGNYVYNILFSIASFHKIYDLGSGLNMYNVQILKDKFYLKYPDNLVFNYCMILGSVFYHHKIKFFPITWSESDQVSNVKMFRQAFHVLRLLFSYVINKKQFIRAEHRAIPLEKYEAEIIYQTENGKQI